MSATEEGKDAASAAESGESFETKKTGWGRLLGTLRFQYLMKAAFAVNGFRGSDDDGVSRGVVGKRGGAKGGGENASKDIEGRGNPRGVGKR